MHEISPLPCQKHLFALPNGLHYINCARMSPLAKPVEEAGLRGLAELRNPEVLGVDRFFDDTNQLRARFAELIGAGEPNRVAVIPSASYGLATVARNLKPERGQNLVVLHEQFPSNLYSWRRLAEEHGAPMRTVCPPEGATSRGAAWNAQLLESIDQDTALVALPLHHWSDGTRFDLVEVGRRAREVGAMFVIDGTQSIGAAPFDLDEIKPDALVCAGYKTLHGPYSLGVAWYGERFDDGIPLEENWQQRKNSEDFAGLVDYEDEYQPGALRYDVGERSNWLLGPMLCRAIELLLEWQPNRIQEYCRVLSEPLVKRAAELGYWVEDADWRGSHLFGLRPPAGVDPREVQRALQERNVSVSVRGTSIRVSPNVYNTPEDMSALEQALAAVLR